MVDRLLHDDMHRIITTMPKDVRKLLEVGGGFLAGGAIRSIIAGEPVSDWDLFGASKDGLELNALRMADERQGKFLKTKNAFTVLAPPRTPVQFISRWLYDQPEPLLASFDFTIARAVICFREGKWIGLCDPFFYPDLAARRLRYMQPERNEDAGGSMLRMQKFLHRGYHIAPESLGKVMARITMQMHRDSSMLDTEDGHAKVITGLLRQVDPLLVVDGLELRDEEGKDVEDGEDRVSCETESPP